MTPRETADLVAAWNEAQSEAAGEVAPPTEDEYEELLKRYG